ncbi:uncharacterized protein LOC123301612 [Chrysoperla carnea]|uniref:uncharacterized protein LOC123301612 n=1 Tax=Chrysoperla carnea TaxID=189513 RepID=UPI001D07B1F6|nr:uncharacterized protein LOC123301612 [Chrysoperla carnea]
MGKSKSDVNLTSSKVKEVKSKSAGSKSKIADSAANVKKAASKTSSAIKKELSDDVKQKLFQKLCTTVKKEHTKNGAKLVKTFGKDPTKKSNIESFNEKINTEITKKMEKMKYNDAKKIKKDFKSINDKILKEAAKTDKILNKAPKMDKGKKDPGAKSSTTSVVSTKSSKSGADFKSCVEGTVNKTQGLIDNYVKSLETGVVTKEGWISSIKKIFGY